MHGSSFLQGSLLIISFFFFSVLQCLINEFPIWNPPYWNNCCDLVSWMNPNNLSVQLISFILFPIIKITLDFLSPLLPSHNCITEENLGTMFPRIIFSLCSVFECELECPSPRKEERLILEAWAYAWYKIHKSFLVNFPVSVIQITIVLNRSFL